MLQTAKFAQAIAKCDSVMNNKLADPDLRAMARFDRGRAIGGAGNERAGLVEIRIARAEMVKLESTNLAELDAWLASNHIPQ
jgi:hypothetical protein